MADHAPSHQRYVKDRCRCDGCRAAHAAYTRRWRAGDTRMVDAGPYRRRLRRLLDRGWCLDGIADASGVSRRTVQELTRPGSTRRRLQRSTAALLDRMLDTVPPPLTALKLDAGPLLEAVEAAGGPSRLPPSDRRAVYRAYERGWILASVADRIVVRFGHTLETLWAAA